MTKEDKKFLIEFVLDGRGDEDYIPTKEDIEQTKQDFDKFQEIDTTQMKKDDLFCEIASMIYQENFKEWEVYICWTRYIEGLSFIDKENPQKKEILETYGKIIVPSDNEYSLKDEEVESLLLKSGFQIDETSKIRQIKNDLVKLWKDKTKMIVPSILENDSKEWEGISFKKFLFCEEYIKTGKVKTTCENLGIGRTTAFEYLKDKEVQDYLQQRQKEMKEESEQVFKNGISKSFEELLKIIEDDSQRDEDLNRKVKAIDTYLRHYENISRPRESEVE